MMDLFSNGKPVLTCCSRCGATITKYWADGWPNYGHIHLGFAAQAFRALAGMKDADSWKAFEAREKRHKAMTKNDPQEIIFEWGAGYKYDSRDRYRLCYNCQEKLLETIGDFFGYGK